METGESLADVEQPIARDEGINRFIESQSTVVTEVDKDSPFPSPHPASGLEKILDVPFQISTFETTNAHIATQKLVDIDPLEEWIKLPIVKSRLIGLKYIRCDMHITLRMNSNIQQCGDILVTNSPLGDNTLPMERCLLFKPIEVSLNSQTNVEFDIRWQIPVDYIRTNYTTWPYVFSRIRIFVINPLMTTDGSATRVEFTLFARATKFVGAGYDGEWVVQGKGNNPAQKTPFEEEAKSKEKGNLGKFTAGLASISKAAERVPIVGDVALFATPIIKAFGSLFDSFGWEKPFGKIPALMQKAYNVTLPNSRGLERGVSFHMNQSTAPDCDGKVFAVNETKFMNILRLALVPILIRLNLTIDYNSSPDDVITTINLGPNELYLVVGSYNYYSPAAVIGRYTLYYRGGQKIMIHFVASKFQTARVRITYVTTESATVSSDTAGQNMSAVVLINGPTVYEFTVPYMNPLPYLATRETYGQVILTVLDPPVMASTAVTTPIRVNIWSSMAEDTKFFEPGANTLPTVCNVSGSDTSFATNELPPFALADSASETPVYDDQCDLHARFDTEFSPIVEGVAHVGVDAGPFGESVDNVHDFLCRPYCTQTARLEAKNTSWQPTAYENIVCLFAWYRLTHRVMYPQSDRFFVRRSYQDDSSGTYDRAGYVDEGEPLEIHVPYSRRVPYFSHLWSMDDSAPIINVGPYLRYVLPSGKDAPTLAFQSYGDDSVFSGLGCTQRLASGSDRSTSWPVNM